MFVFFIIFISDIRLISFVIDPFPALIYLFFFLYYLLEDQLFPLLKINNYLFTLVVNLNEISLSSPTNVSASVRSGRGVSSVKLDAARTARRLFSVSLSYRAFSASFIR